MEMESKITLFYGTFVDLPRVEYGWKHELSIRHGALWVSSSTGRITGSDWSIANESDLQSLIKKNGWHGIQIVRAREEQNEFFFPGFIDTHIHAPQYPNSGLFGSSTLLDWLATYTFPLESALSDTALAHTTYNTVISRTLANGTTCASYYATIHVQSTNLLASLCHSRGQRALIGRVCMDNPSFCPEYYRDESAQDSITKSRETIAHIHALESNVKEEERLVKPILTPRFAPTCSTHALSELGRLAKEYTPPLHIQTHISENLSELDLVKSLFPDHPSYAAVYDACALLTPRTILAHAVHLTPSEKKLIASRKTKISHCPSSNSALGSGLAPICDLLDRGITVGLGTDVSGGYSPSILEAVRQACLVSRLLRHTKRPAKASSEESTAIAGPKPGSDDTEGEMDGSEVLSVEEALYLATRGGAAVVDLPNDLGGFEDGMFWDVQLIRLGPGIPSESDWAKDGARAVDSSSDSAVDIFGWETWSEKVHKWVWTGNDRNVRRVWVRGVLVHELDDGCTGERSLFGLRSVQDLARWTVGALGVAALGLILGKRFLCE
ncbi:chlorohydrolase family protein [Aspergillus mulundensis]|uniref:Probable guanine deaminase n=1 Tax=Aspergillus mulundensis TaxID=1810919 RepID=A0A3D8QZI6_9EURO|nr:hypothetical protein DSM5745_09089 [Aspergillus mulundensis]RDW67223.1 hypothetical protein DSM5745_09089 [Aspergillus mulundensis]